MNNNGFNGTGTAFILYVALAFFMPVAHLYRMARRRRGDFAHTFIAGIFTLAALLSAIALLLVGFVWRRLLHSSNGDVHEFIIAITWLAVATLVLWVLIPQLVVMWYRVRRKSSLLRYVNPLIHPWLEKAVAESAIRSLLIDGVAQKAVGPRRIRLSAYTK